MPVFEQHLVVHVARCVEASLTSKAGQSRRFGQAREALRGIFAEPETKSSRELTYPIVGNFERRR